jgi:integrase
MPIYRDKKRRAFVFEFDRVIPGQGRVRARKRLPKAWNRAQADEFDRNESARLYASARGLEDQASTYLIEDAIAKYVEERVPELKTGIEIAKELANLYPLYAGKPLSALRDVCVAIKKMKRTKGNLKVPLQPATIRNRIRYMTSACRWGWTEHQMCAHDPAEGITVPEVDNERQVYIDRREMLQAARACKNRKARMAIRIGYYSGMRLGEILRAKVTAKGWSLDTTKNGEPRIIPIHRKTAVCARHFHKLKGVMITIQKAWAKARAAVDLQHVHFHDVRHSTASGMVNEGVDLYTIGRVLGHKDPRSTARYAHLDTKTLAAAVGKLGGKSTPPPGT